MVYELHYWPTIQGRGEFVRLALEEAGIRYIDVARTDDGEDVMLTYLDDARITRPPFAPPFLKAGKQIIAQTANILLFLGEQHGLAPATTAGRLWTHQLQLTIADLVAEAHDTHHPIASSLYYECVGDGPPLLLIAGLASDSLSWQPIVADLAAHYRVIAVDNRGAGRTTP
ncbi:MAG TPA: alpha/beta fold hydrolase, partial [Casimicrobiaceae bacterium]|nr:alpha/beta fold hydrolase [Casimicrobiaceae bacterium]